MHNINHIGTCLSEILIIIDIDYCRYREINLEHRNSICQFGIFLNIKINRKTSTSIVSSNLMFINIVIFLLKNIYYYFLYFNKLIKMKFKNFNKIRLLIN